jgi:ribonuclease BN (tRNA processing enzyme)
MNRCFIVALALPLTFLACSSESSERSNTEGESEVSSQTEAASARAQLPAGRTQIVLLGTGNPNADPERSGPALAIVVDDVPYLVDLGPGVVRRAAAAHQAGVEGLAVERLKTAFITHLHTDHTLGYADFMFTPWVLERDLPAEVYGPPGLANMTRHLRAAYERDVRIRIDGMEPANTEGYKVNVHEIEPGVIFEDERVRVTAFAVIHGSWEHAFGYRFDTPDRSIVISGDARPGQSVIEACNGCDVLIHEVYAQAGFDRREPVWQRYHSQFHTSGPELGELAVQARPGVLILYHQLLWGATPEELLGEIRSVFDGPVVYGNDLDVF